MEWNTLEELQNKIELRSKDPNALYRQIKPHLDYDIEYAEGRVKQIKENWDEDLYIDCISSKQFINKQVKNLEDDLSDAGGTMTNHLDRLADYILFCSFDNEEDKTEHDEREAYIKELKAQKKSEKREKELMKARDEKKNRKSLLGNFRMTRSNYKEERLYYINEVGEIEEKQVCDTQEPPTFYVWKDKELNQKGEFKNSRRYWRHFSKHRAEEFNQFIDSRDTQPYATFAFQSLNTFQRDEQMLGEVLLTKQVGSPGFLEIRQRISNTRSNYNAAVEVLRDPTILSGSMKAPKDNMDKDTLRRINYCNEEDIMLIMLGYSELKAKYQYKIGTAWWSVLKDFEQIIQSDIGLKDEEYEMLIHILETGEHTNRALKPALEATLHKEFKDYTLTRMKARVAKKIQNAFCEKTFKKVQKS